MKNIKNFRPRNVIPGLRNVKYVYADNTKNERRAN